MPTGSHEAGGLILRMGDITKLADRLGNLGPTMRRALAVTVEAQTILLQRHVVQNKLSGQVLNVRTGTGRRSITYVVEQGPSFIRGIVGTNLNYMRAHEFGMTIQIPEIRPRTAKALHFMVGGKSVFAMFTRAHAVRLPERSFLRSALQDRKEPFLAAVWGTITAVLNTMKQP